jgi:hypothetical protein
MEWQTESQSSWHSWETPHECVCKDNWAMKTHEKTDMDELSMANWETNLSIDTKKLDLNGFAMTKWEKKISIKDLANENEWARYHTRSMINV